MNMNRSAALDGLRAFVDPYDAELARANCYESLINRIGTLSDTAWESRVNKTSLDEWLRNFDGSAGYDVDVEKLHALYILSQFVYFGVKEIRVLLKSMYRDLFEIPVIQHIRSVNGDTRNLLFIKNELIDELSKTRFLGVGNPSESGVHLLYYFRQENELSKSSFMDASQVQKIENGKKVIRFSDVKRYIFLDDICGSGDTICDYADLNLVELKNNHPEVEFHYHCIFGTKAAMDRVRSHGVFGDNAKAIFELDDTFKSLSAQSRYFKLRPEPIDDAILAKVGLAYGERVAPGNAGGWNDCQLLLGFSHNIPDNTLPIIWRDPKNGSPVAWTAAMRRYMKV